MNMLQNAIKGEMKKEVANTYKKKKDISKKMNASSTRLIDTTKKLDLQGRSLFIFGQENPFRRILAKIVVHEFFEMFIFAIVILSAILMVYDAPLQDPDLQILEKIQTINNVTTGIFITELVMKVIVFGVYFNGS